MRQEVYVDLLFAEATLWNACVLGLTNERCWGVASRVRILAGALLGAGLYVGTVFLPLPTAGKVILEAGCGLLTVFLTYPVRDFKSFLKVVEDYWICGMAWGGLVVLIQRVIRFFCHVKAGVIVLLLEVLTLPVAICHIRSARLRKGISGKAILIKGEKSLCVPAFVDTGNSLFEPISGKPVCVLDARTAKKLWGKEDLFRVVPWHGVNHENGIMQAYSLPELKLLLGGPVKIIRNACVAIENREIPGDVEGRLIIQPKILEGK